MLRIIPFTLCWSVTAALLCYNCSTVNHEWTHCGGEFSPGLKFNSSRHYLTNCTGERAMCFVRSWRARAHNSWLVQRGCYLPTGGDDPLPRAMTRPTRAMSCKHDRLPEAEYSVCLCQADWCNGSSNINPFIHYTSFTETIFIFILVYIVFT